MVDGLRVLLIGWLWLGAFGPPGVLAADATPPPLPDANALREQDPHSLPSPEELKELPPDGGPEFNRLVFEKSPYLLQHARNPVDWYPWGANAMERARREDKPIFLSVGYATCHWCHVMERESFENPEIAALLNKHFVCIKVDREERPDVDAVYMAYVQALPGGGGWPMSVWLTPDLKPFMGGTYFPPEDRGRRVGLRTLLEQIAEGWQTDREQIVKLGDSVLERLRAAAAARESQGELSAQVAARGYRHLKFVYDPENGGFGAAPKFPWPVSFDFLLHYFARTQTDDARDMTVYSLRRMADGGIHDPIGGGFHRYATDARWHIPHFEKMLYSQAQLVAVYLDAYQVTHDEFFADVARDILEYVQRDMTGDGGRFYSAEDADSPSVQDPEQMVEGAFYVWEAGEIEQVLGAEDAAVFDRYYGVRAQGNVPRSAGPEFDQQNVLIVSQTLDETAEHFGKSRAEIQAVLSRARVRLLEARAKRPRPRLDDKTLTAWNGLMISAFARAYEVLGDPSYRDSAIAAARFIRSHLYDATAHTLRRRYRAGETSIHGFADDYAFLIQGLLDLHEATFDIAYLTWAIDLQKTQDALFWDVANGGYFSTTGDDASILIRIKNANDDALPSANSVAAVNLLRLAELTDEATFRQHAKQTPMAFSAVLQRTPEAMPLMLVALGRASDPPRQIILAGNANAADTRTLLDAIHARFLPDTTLLFADGGRGQEMLARYVPFLKDVKALDGKATAYVCENFTCQLPTTNVAVLVQLLDAATPGATAKPPDDAP